MTAAVWVVFDLGFGDAGKGATVDFLVRQHRADLVVRFNGGAQAGHNVIAPDGRHHTFSQFGAGTFVPNTRTLLGPEFVLHPGALLLEEQRLLASGVSDALTRTSIDGRALVISPFQQAAGRLRELHRRDQAHGTCGVGVGEAVGDAHACESDVIRAADLADRDRLARNLESQRQRKQREIPMDRDPDHSGTQLERSVLRNPESVERTMECWSSLPDRLNLLDARATHQLIQGSETVVFEGAQGVLLDQDHGFHPHTTWSDCTPRAALSLLRDIETPVTRIGVMRSYMVRHGPGPFPTHDPAFDVQFPEIHNDDAGWQGCFRRGPLDFVLLRYALEVCGGVDGVALNCLDQASGGIDVCHSYQSPGVRIDRLIPPTAGDQSALGRLGSWIERLRPVTDHVAGGRLVETVEKQLGVRVLLSGTGPSSNDRNWH